MGGLKALTKYQAVGETKSRCALEITFNEPSGYWAETNVRAVPSKARGTIKCVAGRFNKMPLEVCLPRLARATSRLAVFSAPID